MPKHRTLDLAKFVHGISWELFQRYFDGLLPGRQPSPWAFLNENAMEQFLSDPQNAEASAVIMEDFQSINDIAAEGMNLIVLAYDRTVAPFDQEQSVQELAMRLFLDHPDAFQFAWSRYLFFGASSKLTSYPIDMPPLNITDETVEQFRADLQRWFSRLAKGNQCRVNWFQEPGQTMLHIQRGSYVRTIARWKEDRIEIESFRPASEDLMIYDSEQSDLTIKAGLAKERAYYLQAFATHLAGDIDLARRAMDSQSFSLIPLQEGTFDYTGNGVITRVTLVWAKLRLNDRHSTQVQIKSTDVMATLHGSLREVSLNQGQLIGVRLRVQLQPDNQRPATVSFDIEPPARTNLAQKRYANIIEDYLKEQESSCGDPLDARPT